MLDLMRASVGIAAVGPGLVGHNTGIELLFEFAAQLGHPLLGLLGKLLLGGALLHAIHRLPSLVFEFAEQRLDLALIVACLLPLLVRPLGLQALEFASQLLFSFLGRPAFA